jgi:hypothetical protein
MDAKVDPERLYLFIILYYWVCAPTGVLYGVSGLWEVATEWLSKFKQSLLGQVINLHSPMVAFMRKTAQEIPVFVE